jgi:pantoate--beta-alanine ligase
MWIANRIPEARQCRGNVSGTVALVPTMGALHAGHLSLIERARELAGHVVVSIFVNPRQFGPDEDLGRYPRPIEKDLQLCIEAGVDGIFAPVEEQMYPMGGFSCHVDVPLLTKTLEGEHRPGHFPGVCLVVAKLFNIIDPDIAVFGQKDYQQLRAIEAMVQSLSMRVRIEPAPTVREDDGLAMSSRNVYLNDEQRQHALGLVKALRHARDLVEMEAETDPAVVENAMRHTMTANHVQVDYAAVRHPKMLTTLDCIEPKLTGGVVALVAGRVGDVRLIDNMVLAKPG